jgi:CBS domain-containing protein
MRARDIMDTSFHVLHPRDDIAAAVRKFKEASRKEGKKVFGMMVVDDSDHLVGMLSMYDILIYIQPKNMQVWGEMEDLDPDQVFEVHLNRAKSVQVGDIMTPEVVTISPNTHILSISDLMIKKHIRRLPVVEQDHIVGIVYVSMVFYHMLNRFLD